MKDAGLIFPHQLFDSHPVIRNQPEKVFLIEDSLFFGDSRYPLSFHKQKLRYQYDTLDYYERRLSKESVSVERVIYTDSESSLPALFKRLKKAGFQQATVCDPHDFELNRRLNQASQDNGLVLNVLTTPAFLNTPEENSAWRSRHKRWSMVNFYKHQRLALGVLLDGDEPVGGKWSFDEDNRKKLPKKEVPNVPALPTAAALTATADQAKSYSLDQRKRRFRASPGLDQAPVFPTTHVAAKRWLDVFCEQRFKDFGAYEDAIVPGENWLYHSVLTPMLNCGLLQPKQVLDTVLEAAAEFDVPMNSLEGFVRQIIGWREFMRATYDDLGVEMRNGNHWEHHQPLPKAFYDANTGIAPVDDAITRILETGYCHHIERLMVLGGFMFLCEIEPDGVYRWFMEMFVDSYDWVMVPNVYAMSQHADGGNITTKPYFSGSNYLFKMSHYRKGEWSVIWDGLFWRWVLKNQERLVNNHRWSMIVRNAQKMDTARQQEHCRIAQAYLATLH